MVYFVTHIFDKVLIAVDVWDGYMLPHIQASYNYTVVPFLYNHLVGK
jgi:hypothetical protein